MDSKSKIRTAARYSVEDERGFRPQRRNGNPYRAQRRAREAARSVARKEARSR